MPADQARLVAAALGQAVVAAVALQGAGGQVLAARAVAEARRVVVVFQVRRGAAVGVAFELDARFGEVVVAPRGAAGARGQAQAEALDHRHVGHQPGVLLVGHRGQRGEYGLVVAEHQRMALRAVLEVVVDTLLLAQALDEVQVGLVVLHAVHPLGVHRAEHEAVVAGEDAVLLEHLGDDLRHRLVLEDALVDAVCQVRQLRAQHQPVARQAPPRFALRGAVDQPVNAAAAGRQLQEGERVQEGFEVQRRPFTDQLQFEFERLAERFAPAERQHLKVAVDPVQGQGEMGLVGR